jgi:uncharacterized protein (TIGR02145 family)
MLTNLAYAGGGTNTYGDVKTIANGYGAGNNYTIANYYKVPDNNAADSVMFTIEPTNPSTATDFTGQYGYVYNVCAAMGAQLSTSSCANATTPATSASISICPNGWRIPTNPEYDALTTALTVSGVSSTWLARKSGYWDFNAISNYGNYSWYWSSSELTSASYWGFYQAQVGSTGGSGVKYLGFSVRCIAV